MGGVGGAGQGGGLYTGQSYLPTSLTVTGSTITLNQAIGGVGGAAGGTGGAGEGGGLFNSPAGDEWPPPRFRSATPRSSRTRPKAAPVARGAMAETV